MFTHFFIDRPILSAVISILIVLAGAVSMSVSPIEQYPDMAPPQVTIDARYPAAERMLASEDAKEGPRAFAEKRKPRWRGR